MRKLNRWFFSLVLLLGASAAWASPHAAPVEGTSGKDGASSRKVGWLTLDKALRSGPVPFAWVPEADAGPSLAGVLAAIDRVRTDDAYPGLVVCLDQAPLSMTQRTAIADALLEVREAGKTVMVFAEAYELGDYLIASAADHILMQHKGGAMLLGMGVEEMFLAGTLEKIGVKPDFIQIGKFKGADEQFMRTGPSEAWSENFDGLLDGLYAETVDRIARNRGWTRAEFEALMAGSFTMTDEQLVANGVIDQLVSRDLTTATEVSFGDNWDWDTQLTGAAGAGLDTENPFAMFAAIFAEPANETTRDTLAVIHADGPIYSGESSTGGGLMSDTSIGSRTMTAALEKALLDDNVKGVVIRLDSPGGSALASEVIWQAVREVGTEKPVYAVVQGMAASGGYYIVCAADQIYVQPHSIVGSIGVVAGKMTLAGMYEWAGIKINRRTRGPGGDLFNSVDTFTDAQRMLLTDAMRMTYEQFRERVATGRGDRLADLDAVDEGMLFTGTQAVDNGMADRVGGLDLALTDLAEQCGLDEGEYDVLNLPGPMPLAKYLNEAFGVRAPGAAAGAAAGLEAMRGTLRRVVGEAAFGQAAAVVDGLMLLQREPVLTLMPSAIVVR